MKARVLTNTRLNRVFYGRDSIIDVSAKDAAHLASIGLVEILADQIPEEALEPVSDEAADEPKKPTKAIKAKSSKKAAKE